MSIYFGNDTANDLYVGLTPVTKGYVGTHLFYNGDNTIIDITYEKYILNTHSSTLYNTVETPIKSVILKGDTKYRDIDTEDILDTFDETKNLELVSVKKPVLTTSNEDDTKTDILTVNEDVTLRGISKIKDELNLLTGELTQRVGEVVLDGSEDWVLSGMDSSSIFYTTLNDLVHTTFYLDSIKCDKFKTYGSEGGLNNSTDLNGISGYADTYNSYPNDNWLYIKHVDSGGSVENFKQLLSQNPVTVQYQLTTESVKTIDISTVDQGGNDTELKTFDDLTHVTLSSEGLIPEAELEVATKNEEVLNTMSLEMDDISATQTTLEETSNTQSENVDATMIATTEIYEQLL